MIDDIFTVIYILTAIIVVALIYGIVFSIHKSVKQNDAKKGQDRLILTNGINVTRDLQYNGPTEKCRFIVDDDNKVVYASSSQSEYRLVQIPYNEILNVNTHETYFEDGSVGGAIFGGMMAGGVGSYLGATRGRQYISSYEIVINRRNFQCPQFKMTLFSNARVDPNSNTYKEALEFSRELKAIVNVIRCSW